MAQKGAGKGSLNWIVRDRWDLESQKGKVKTEEVRVSAVYLENSGEVVSSVKKDISLVIFITLGSTLALSKRFNINVLSHLLFLLHYSFQSLLTSKSLLGRTQ